MNDHKFNIILDAFKETSNSTHWPSSDLGDSPYNTFECKVCGWKFDGLVGGTFYIREDPYDAIKKKALEHLAFKHNIATHLMKEKVL